MRKHLPKICLPFIIATLLLTFNTQAADMPQQRPNKIVHLQFFESSGLGNRLKKIVSYLRYYNPKHLNLYWSTENWVTASFYDLFSPEWKTTVSEFNLPSTVKNFNYNEPLQPWVNEYSLLVAANDFNSGSHMFIDTRYNDIPPEIIRIYAPYFQAIKPSAAVKRRINEVKLPTNTVAVQVRNAPDWQHYFQVEEPAAAFFAIMDKYPPDTIFYLSAMSKESAAPFYARYPNRIIELPNKDYHSMFDAAADMYLLGSTKEAIYQYNSTFSEAGWWLGGAKAKVHIVGSNVTPIYPQQPLKVLKNFPEN